MHCPNVIIRQAHWKCAEPTGVGVLALEKNSGKFTCRFDPRDLSQYVAGEYVIIAYHQYPLLAWRERWQCYFCDFWWAGQDWKEFDSEHTTIYSSRIWIQ